MGLQNRRAHAQQLALLFIVLAMGALHNLELPPDDPTAGEYLALSRDALEAGDFIINNTIAGVQTLVSIGCARYADQSRSWHIFICRVHIDSA